MSDDAKENALRMHDDTLRHLVDKEILILTVRVTTLEQAEQIIEWMYAPDKPMKAELIELAWNKRSVSKDEAEFIEIARKLFNPY